MADVAETIEESGRRVGEHAWIEMRLFERLGRWSGTVPDDEVRALFASQAHHHAWHVEMWHGLLPAVPHLAGIGLVAPAPEDAGIVAGLDLFDAAPDRPDGEVAPPTDPRTDAAARLAYVADTALPHLVDTLTDHLARTTPVTDGPTARVLRLVVADLQADRDAGRTLLERRR